MTATHQPPSSITGGKLPKPSSDEIGLDWLQGTFPRSDLPRVRQIVSVVACDFVPQSAGRNHYVECEAAPNGVFFAFSDGRDDACFAIPGKPLGTLDAEGQWKLFAALFDAGVKFTRIDIRFDDYERVVTPDVIDAFVFQRGEGKLINILNFRQCWLVAPRDQQGMRQGCGFYIGKRGNHGGGRSWCIYDKLLETGDEGRNCIRWECRLQDARAYATALMLRDSTDAQHFVVRLGEVLGGNVDFVDRDSGDHHVDRLERPEWWKRIQAKLGSVIIRPRRITPKLRHTMKYLGEQYGPTLATVKFAFEALGANFLEWIDEITAGGELGMRETHYSRAGEFVDEEKRLESELVCNGF